METEIIIFNDQHHDDILIGRNDAKDVSKPLWSSIKHKPPSNKTKYNANKGNAVLI